MSDSMSPFVVATDAVGQATKALRAELDRLTKEAEARNARLRQLQAAIDALEGKAVAFPLPATPKPPGAPDMVHGAAKALEAEFGTGTVFDYQTLLAKLDELHKADPAALGMARRGVYTAVAALKKRGLMEITQGGHRLTAKGRS